MDIALYVNFKVLDATRTNPLINLCDFLLSTNFSLFLDYMHTDVIFSLPHAFLGLLPTASLYGAKNKVGGPNLFVSGS